MTTPLELIRLASDEMDDASFASRIGGQSMYVHLTAERFRHAIIETLEAVVSGCKECSEYPVSSLCRMCCLYGARLSIRPLLKEES